MVTGLYGLVLPSPASGVVGGVAKLDAGASGEFVELVPEMLEPPGRTGSLALVFEPFSNAGTTGGRADGLLNRLPKGARPL